MSINRETFIEKYGDIEVKFSHYYKYTFTFVGCLPDGSSILCSVGGNPDDIYRFEVSNDSVETVASLYPYYGTITRDGVTQEEFYEY